jgi:hypothetical protein
MRPLVSSLTLVVAVALAAAAPAQPYHERVKAEPIAKDGEVVGLRLELTLRPNDRYQNVVRVGLGPITATGRIDENRENASDPAAGYLLHQWPEITFGDAELSRPSPRTFEVLFEDAPGLVPGRKVEVISAWNNATRSSYWHIWGLQAVARDATHVVTIPSGFARAAAGRPSAAHRLWNALRGRATPSAAPAPRNRQPRP